MRKQPNAKKGPSKGCLTGILGLVLAVCFGIGWADSWDGIRAAADRVDSISADFTQAKHLPILARPLVSRGVFHYRKPDSLRWEYQHPLRNILLMHNGTLRRYQQSGQGLKETPGSGVQAMQFVMAEITDWLRGRFDTSRIFTARLEGGRKIVLLPKEAAFGKVIQKIELQLSGKPGLLDSVTIYESSDSFTRITFEHTRLNVAFPEDLFRSAG